MQGECWCLSLQQSVSNFCFIPFTSRCDICCITFRTHRGLLRHNAVIHKQLPRDPMGKPFIQNNPSIPAGFHDLGFTDFSCRKFPRISQVHSVLHSLRYQLMKCVLNSLKDSSLMRQRLGVENFVESTLLLSLWASNTSCLSFFHLKNIWGFFSSFQWVTIGIKTYKNI